MPLVLAYVSKEGNIHERFTKFIHCNSEVTEEALQGESVNCIANELNLDIQDCQEQRYNGAGNMAGKYKGLAACIQGIGDMALFTHCASLKRNLCVAASCKIRMFAT